jgi:hypothetical protein
VACGTWLVLLGLRVRVGGGDETYGESRRHDGNQGNRSAAA